MKVLPTLLILILITFQSFSQQPSGKELLEKAIKYHDPSGQWKNFSGEFIVTMKTKNKLDRISNITIDLPKQTFSVKTTIGKNFSEYFIDKNTIQISFNGDNNPSEETLNKNGLSAARAKMYKDYYTYLYGLPMKLKDPGAIVHHKVMLKEFNKKKRWMLKVTYPNERGKDTWYFYFNLNSYKMEAYQFFHDESKNDGEYILLQDEVIVDKIIMPKVRAWYTNKEKKHLGTDILKVSK